MSDLKIFGVSFFLMVSGCFTLYAGPRIEVDEKKADKGIINEAKTKAIVHSFKIYNTGDSELKIKKVKPGCGCTVADFDESIPPGDTGKVTQKTYVSKLYGNSFHKSMRIYTNAENEEITTVSIHGKIQRPINTSTNYIRIKPAKDSSASFLLQLSSPKKDLKVKDVKFVPRKRRQDGNWNLEKTQFADFKLENTDEKDDIGGYKYNLSIKLYTDNQKRKFGKFVITTNHPDKEVLKINGMIDIIK